MTRLKVGRLHEWLSRFNEDVELELDCFNGTAFLKVPRPSGWERISLEDGSVQGFTQGRISCSTPSIQEIDKKKTIKFDNLLRQSKDATALANYMGRFIARHPEIRVIQIQDSLAFQKSEDMQVFTDEFEEFYKKLREENEVTCPYCKTKFKHSGKVEFQVCPKCKSELIC